MTQRPKFRKNDRVSWKDPGSRRRTGKVQYQERDGFWAVQPDESSGGVEKISGDRLRISNDRNRRRDDGSDDEGRRNNSRKNQKRNGRDRRRNGNRNGRQRSHSSGGSSDGGSSSGSRSRSGSESSGSGSKSGSDEEGNDYHTHTDSRAFGAGTDDGGNAGGFGFLSGAAPSFLENLAGTFSPQKFGMTAMCGLAAGYVTGKAVDELVYYVGIAIVVFQVAVFKGWLGEGIQEMVYGKARRYALNLLDHDGNGELEFSDLMGKMGEWKTILATGISDVAGFGLGFVLGIGKGSEILSGMM